jgi:peptide/nickel transport system substrate-binding protein
MGRNRDDESMDAFDRFVDAWSRRDFLRRMGAGAAFVAFSAGAGEFLAACGAGGGGTSQTGGDTPKKGGHIIEVLANELKDLNPVLTSDVYSNNAISLLYDGLYTDDFQGNQVGMLATGAPQISSDQKSYTIQLRDAKWTDGRPVTADDVKFTYDLMWDPKYKVVNSPRRADLEKYVAGITVKDPKTIVFQLTQPYAPFLSTHLEYGVLPQHVWGSLPPEAINSTELNRKPTVTNGTFRDPEWVKGQQITFTANKDYYRGAPHLDKWVTRAAPSSTQVLNLLKTGEADVSNAVDPSQVEAASAIPDLNVKSWTSLGFLYYLYNMDPAKTKLFVDKRVRQALFYALDRAAIAKSVWFDQAVPANGSESPVSWAHADVEPRYDHDVAKAEKLLDEAGFKKGPDGIRANGDLKLAFTTLTNAGVKPRENTLVAMQEQWKKIGVAATPKFVDFNLELVPNVTNKRDYQIAMLGFSWNSDPDQSEMWSSENTRPGGFNGMGYKSPEMDKLLEDAVHTTDRTKRKQIYKRMQERVADDLPCGILFFTKANAVTNKRVRGYDLNAFVTWTKRLIAKDVWVTDQK